MIESSLAASARVRPRLVRLRLRDRRILEGSIHLADGQFLAPLLGMRRGWLNLTEVHWVGTGQTSRHVAFQVARVLWASSVGGDIPLASFPPAAVSRRSVEVELEGGLGMRGILSIVPGQRLTDYLGSILGFIPVRAARLLPRGSVMGDVAINPGAILKMRELLPEADAPPAADSEGAMTGNGSADEGVREALRTRIEILESLRSALADGSPGSVEMVRRFGHWQARSSASAPFPEVVAAAHALESAVEAELAGRVDALLAAMKRVSEPEAPAGVAAAGARAPVPGPEEADEAVATIDLDGGGFPGAGAGAAGEPAREAVPAGASAPAGADDDIEFVSLDEEEPAHPDSGGGASGTGSEPPLARDARGSEDDEGVVTIELPAARDADGAEARPHVFGPEEGAGLGPEVEVEVLPAPEPGEPPPALAPPPPGDGGRGAAAAPGLPAAAQHWLVQVARRARLPGAEELAVAPRTAVADAWAAVAHRCGISDEELARRVAEHFRLRLADLDLVQPQALKLVPERLAQRHHVFPLRDEDRYIVVATCDPTDLNAEQALTFSSGRQVRFEVATPAALQDAIASRYSPDKIVEGLLSRLEVPDEVADTIRVVAELDPEEDQEAADVDSEPLVRLTNMILRDAIEAGASDIHIEPERNGGTVRYRVDGVLRTHLQMPAAAHNRVVSRIKILGNLDIADRFRPQDGRARLRMAGKFYDLRISTVPTRDAEKAVMRIFNPDASKRLADLDMPQQELSRLRQLLAYRDGIVAVTGPTGSGKTTTLYAALRDLSTGEENIMTVENPVEYELPGITQIQVEPKRGVTFGSALRAILRQDPDIILIGEIRDPETADIAVQAAMTGHLVLATLHTNDAAGVVPRLVDLGLDRASMAATLRGALAQRLIRRVCPHCVERLSGPLTPDEQRLAEAYGVEPVVRAVGCKRCGQTGYRGRMAVLEVMAVTGSLQQLIAKGATGQEVARASVAGGMRPMLQVALERVRSGETTLQEVERVLGERIDDAPQERARGGHILVVDDDPETRLLARSLLEKGGFKVSEAIDGAAALERIGTGEPFGLVVLDLEMPRLAGREVLARLRASPATARLPVVILTGRVESEVEARLMQEGADDYIRKPIDPSIFVARIQAALRRAGA